MTSYDINDIKWHHEIWRTSQISSKFFKKRHTFFSEFFKKWNSSKKVKKRHKKSINNKSVKLYKAWRVRKFEVIWPQNDAFDDSDVNFKRQYASFWRQLTSSLNLERTLFIEILLFSQCGCIFGTYRCDILVCFRNQV